MKTTKPLLFLVLFVLFQLQHSAEGFDDRAHTSLSGRAAQVSGLDNYLQVNLTPQWSPQNRPFRVSSKPAINWERPRQVSISLLPPDQASRF